MNFNLIRNWLLSQRRHQPQRRGGDLPSAPTSARTFVGSLSVFCSVGLLGMMVSGSAIAGEIGYLYDTQVVVWGGFNWPVTPPATPIYDFTQVAAGYNFSVGLRRDGSLFAWGNNSFGQINVPTGNGFTQVSAGEGHGLALRTDGSLVAWGWNSSGQTNAPAGNNFKQIAGGFEYSLALRSDDSLVAWGDNYVGQTNTPSGNDFVSIGCGNDYGLAVRANGSVVCWGNNSGGKANAPSGNNFKQVAGGGEIGSQSLALRTDGSLLGWGANGGALANAPAGNNYTAIDCGEAFSLALRADGSLTAWGPSPFGTEVSGTPTSGHFVAIAAGFAHGVGLKQRENYEDLEVFGTGLSATLQRDVAVSGNATISTQLTLTNKSTMTIATNLVLSAGAGVVGEGTIRASSLVLNSGAPSVVPSQIVWTNATLIATGAVVQLTGGLGNAGGPLVVMENAQLQTANVINRRTSGTGTITATGSLVIGDVTRTDGFDFDGTLAVGSRLVLLLDADEAELGALTTLTTGGRLNSFSGLRLGPLSSVDPLKVLTATGDATIASAFRNNGTINGPGGSGWLTFTDDVTGAGSYTGNVRFDDGFSPGNSPAIVSLENGLLSGAHLTMEIGGDLAGTEYDQLDILGSFDVQDSTLDLVFLNGYSPEAKKSYQLFDGQVNGQFTQVTGLPTGWQINYSGGGVFLVPEPSTFWLMAAGAAWLARGRRRNR